MSLSKCQHLDFDDYFGKCFDCDAQHEDIHEAECKRFEMEEDDDCFYCGNCGLVLKVKNS